MEDNVIQERSSTMSLFQKVFLWMFMGLLATGIVSWFTYSSGLTETIAFNMGFQIVALIEIAVVVVFSLFFRKLPPIAASILFFIYAVMNGICVSTIFYFFELDSITLIFFASAAVYGITGLLGYITKIDLSRFWPMLFVTLIIGVIVSIINIFVGNTMLDVILTWILLLEFFVITAYDVQRMKIMSEAGYDTTEKLHIYGAMELYLDFINIFLKILGLFGKRK
ncbi:MAG: Bax inhibitor-1/YccA family protein [Clostridia bacterium]|nr:Bax inhibitor-1/YccA family protein [Clostridia bacterium]